MATPAFCTPATTAIFYKAVRRLQGFRKVDKTLQSLLALDVPFAVWKTFNIKKLAKKYKDVPEVKDDVEKLLVKIEKQRKKEENQRMHENRRLRAMELESLLGSAPKMGSVELKKSSEESSAPKKSTTVIQTVQKTTVDQKSTLASSALTKLPTVIPTTQKTTVAKKPTTVIQMSQKTTVTKNLPTVIQTSQKTTVLLKSSKSFKTGGPKNEATPTLPPKIRINTAPKPECTLAAPSFRILKRQRPSDCPGTPEKYSNPQEEPKMIQKYSNLQMSSDRPGAVQEPKKYSNPNQGHQGTTHGAQKYCNKAQTAHIAQDSHKKYSMPETVQKTIWKYSNPQILLPPQPLFQSAEQRLSQLDSFGAQNFQMRMEAELRRAEEPMSKKMKLGV